MTKLIDVARKAGCSPTTVSRVINNYGYISEKTRKKVFQAMAELHYQPNSAARSLQGKKTQLVGLIFPTVSNPFFGELVSKIENQLFTAGYKTILCNAEEKIEKERSYLQMLTANKVDGIIAGAHNLDIAEYQETGLPIVSFDRKLSDNIPIVSSDNYLGGELATQELYDNGARKIYFVGTATITGQPTDRRLQGYKNKIKQLGLEPRVQPISSGEKAEIKEMVIQNLLSTKVVDGIVASDDLTASLCLNIAERLSLSVPQDLKIIGFDGSQVVRTLRPDLSTIVQPTQAIARLLVKLLEERIAHPHEPLTQDTYTLPVELLRRKSSSHQ